MTVTWSQQLSLPELHAVLASPQGGVVRDLLRRGLLVESAAKRNLSGIGGPKRIDTGRLRAAGAVIVMFRNGEPVILIVFATNYARFVHDGTGIYGPHGVPIQPRSGKFLRFPATGQYRTYQPKPGPKGKIPKARRRSFIYIQQVKGMQPNPFLKNALPAARG